MVAQIRTEGFKQLARALRKVGADFNDDLKKTNQEVAEFAKGKAAAKAQGLGGVAAKAAPSLRATKTAGYAAIRLGGARYPWALGAEFGSKFYGQFDAWRGPMSDTFTFGYFLGPAIRENRDNIVIEWQKGIEEILSKAFPR